MINFFRKIRQRLLTENKFSKYILYALGEIALVVVGILIALQINNWNQIKKNNVEESKLLDRFQEEFSRTNANIVKIKSHYADITNSNRNLMNLIGKSSSQINASKVDSLLAVAINIENFLPSNYVLDDMVSTGKLELISSEKLRVLLYEWNQELGQKEDNYQMLYKYFMEELIPYLNKHASIKNIDFYTVNGFISEPSNLNHNSTDIFQDIVFENHLDNYFYTVSSFKESLSKLEDIATKILIESKNNK